MEQNEKKMIVPATDQRFTTEDASDALEIVSLFAGMLSRMLRRNATPTHNDRGE